MAALASGQISVAWATAPSLLTTGAPSLFHKVTALLVSVPLTAAVEGWLLEYQCVFRLMRGCGDKLFCLGDLTELALERQHRLHLSFGNL